MFTAICGVELLCKKVSLFTDSHGHYNGVLPYSLLVYYEVRVTEKLSDFDKVAAISFSTASFIFQEDR